MTQDLLKNRCCVILTNFGDDSLALIQWALGTELLQYQRQHKLLKVVYVETGFASCTFAKQIARGCAYIENAGIELTRLTAPITFQEAVMGRGAFPTPKFQWCSTVLKGLPLLDWLDDRDPACQNIILSAKRRETLIPPYHTLPEWIEKSDHFNDRSVWHPIIEMDEVTRDLLLKQAHLRPLKHRSKECDPCINSSTEDLTKISPRNIEIVKQLETDLKTSMFEDDNCSEKQKADPSSSHYLSLFYRGCGNPYSCGL